MIQPFDRRAIPLQARRLDQVVESIHSIALAIGDVTLGRVSSHAIASRAGGEEKMQCESVAPEAGNRVDAGAGGAADLSGARSKFVVVLGHPEFWPRFGFSAKMASRLRSLFSGPAFLAIESELGAPESVEGEVRYPPPFARL